MCWTAVDNYMFKIKWSWTQHPYLSARKTGTAYIDCPIAWITISIKYVLQDAVVCGKMTLWGSGVCCTFRLFRKSVSVGWFSPLQLLWYLLHTVMHSHIKTSVFSFPCQVTLLLWCFLNAVLCLCLLFYCWIIKPYSNCHKLKIASLLW